MSFCKPIVWGTLALLCASAAASAQATQPAMKLEVMLAGDKPQKVIGTLVAFDEAGLVMSVKGEEKAYAWSDLQPLSAHTARLQIMDKKDANAWLELGKWAWEAGLEKAAKADLAKAVQLDKSLADAVKEITAAQSDAPTSKTATAGAGAGKGPQKFLPATKEQADEAMAAYRKSAEGISKDIGVKFAELETAHFIIFTDWDKSEYDFLKNNFEGAYRLCSNWFGLSVKDNIFVGKLPVFMYATSGKFIEHALEVDGMGSAGESLLGYYAGKSDGSGHMVMWKPRVSKHTAGQRQDDAEQKWARVLTHEFVHAFIARYRTNERIPRWMNEGLAEVISQDAFPSMNYIDGARRMGQVDMDLGPLFNDDVMPGGSMYPVMKTMVQMLINEDSKKFVRMFNAIKDGGEPQAMLQKYFGCDYTGLQSTWRDRVKKMR